MQPCRNGADMVSRRLQREDGSAVLEFTFLGLMLLVPVVYLILVVAQLQGASFAVVGAADHSAKVFASSAAADEGELRARQAAVLAVQDFGFDPADMDLSVACSETCLDPGSVVTVTVRLRVPLPLVPAMAGRGPAVATLDSSATQSVGRFR